MRPLLAFALLAIAPACRTLNDPAEVGREYARALRESRLEDAYALLSDEDRSRVGWEAFSKRYADAVARNERATAIEAAVDRMRAESQELSLVRVGEGWRVEDPAPDVSGPKVAMERFLAAADRGDFASVWGLMAESWRSRYTPERLKEDFEREPLAKERLSRARQALKGPAIVRGDAAEYRIGDGKAVRLVREGGAYRVVALE